MIKLPRVSEASPSPSGHNADDGLARGRERLPNSDPHLFSAETGAQSSQPAMPTALTPITPNLSLSLM
ncbi:hypothetical protein J6590_054611 [Homalodisca vitripennis]|nr:hypothetical protein J6590_054611 [Homalodisca vitripennis]